MTDKSIKSLSKKAGLSSGTLAHKGEKKTEPVNITIINYSEAQFSEIETKSVEECVQFKDKPTVTWINIDGIHQPDIIENIGKCYDLHPLILEDILNTWQRPKKEDFGNYIFFVLKMLYYDAQKDVTSSEHMSLVLGQNFVISFQERKGDVFEEIREQIRNDKGRIRKMGADYLAYSLLYAIVDGYFTLLEKIGEDIERVENRLIVNPIPKTLQIIHRLKRKMIALRKSVWPLREVISGLGRDESSLIGKTTRIYFRDLYDHTIQVIDTIETYRDMISGMLDIYLSSVSNRMNKVMKILTIIATIFIPLTFITGIYGMNFRFMPELTWRLGYPLILLVMAVIGIAMLVYFRIKKWF